MTLVGDDILDKSLIEQLQRTFSRHISFTKKLSVSGIISYSVDGSPEKFVKINFSFDDRRSLEILHQDTNPELNQEHPLNVTTDVQSAACALGSPPILPSTTDDLISIERTSSHARSVGRRGRRKASKPRRQLLNAKPYDSESPDVCSDDKQEEECVLTKKAKIELPDASPAIDQPPVIDQHATPLQQLISSLVNSGVRLDNQKNPFVTTLTCGVPVTDATRLTQSNIGPISLADLLTKHNTPPSILSSEINSDGLLSAICETPGQPPKNVFISKSVAAAFAAAAMAGNNLSQATTSSTKTVEELGSCTRDSQPPTTAVETFTTLANSNINLVRWDSLGQGLTSPISINLPINTSTASSQPSFTVIGSLPNNGPAIFSIGNPSANRGIPASSNASAIAALIRQLTQQKTPTDIEMPISSTVTTLSSETPIMTTSSADSKTVSDQTSTNLPIDLNSLAAALAAVTGIFPRNPTITTGPVPGSILLSCPKLSVSGDQTASLLNIVNQSPGETISVPTSSATTGMAKGEIGLKGPSDTAIDQILENIRRASEAEKPTRASFTPSATTITTSAATNGLTVKVKHDDIRSALFLPQGGSSGRLALPPKKTACKLAPVAPSPASKADLVSSSVSSSSNIRTTSTPRHSSIESVRKVYKCRYCGKTFNRKFCRERHERLHTGVKPYTCEICDDKFIRLEDKKRHVRSILHTTRVAAAQASGRAIPAGLDPQDMSEEDCSPVSDHRETESSEDPIQLSTSPSPPTQAAAFKHSRRSELKQSNAPIRLLTTSDGTEVG